MYLYASRSSRGSFGAPLVQLWCYLVHLLGSLGAPFVLLWCPFGLLWCILGATLVHLWCYLGSSLALLWSYVGTTLVPGVAFQPHNVHNVAPLVQP